MQRQLSFSVDSATGGKMDSFQAGPTDMETIFSPILESIDRNPNDDDGTGWMNNPDVVGLETHDGYCDRRLSDNQTCDVSDFYIYDMVVVSLPFPGNDDDMCEIDSYHDYKYVEQTMLFDVSDQYMMLPFLEDAVEVSDSCNANTREEMLINQDNSSLYLEMDQMKPPNKKSDFDSDADQTECFDPQLFIRSFPELSDIVSNFQPNILPIETRKRKAVTLALDLDETLVHSTLEQRNDADFTFTVCLNNKDHIVCVKQRPYLHMFLERVAEMFEVVIFTASQSIYAGQVLNMLDPEKRLISRRVYRESCIFSDGSYTKDLTVLGVDLAKVFIIDNSPQVFQLQVNNGIPIKSWFDDPSDSALISLLPFLETLVDVDDVRPIIAKKFGNKE